MCITICTVDLCGGKFLDGTMVFVVDVAINIGVRTRDDGYFNLKLLGINCYFLVFVLSACAVYVDS